YFDRKRPATWHLYSVLATAANPAVRIKRSSWVSGLSGQPLCRVTGWVSTAIRLSCLSFFGRQAHLEITPDGPRGPRRQVQLGLIYIAAPTRRPIIPTGFGFCRPWRLRSWDRFALPRPWSACVCVTAEPICVPEDAGKEELEEYRVRVDA